MLLLIDNCNLLELVYSEGYSQYLIALENFVNAGNISLITHKLILEEWQKHRPIDKNRKQKKLLKKNAKYDLQPDNLLPIPVGFNYEHLDLQYAQIDKLLSDAKIIDTPEVILTEFSERYRKRLAPFHKLLNSQNDWEIFGSVANYCLVNGIDSLYFISSNIKQFADIDDTARKIHRDLEERFTGLTIIYYRDISVFIEEMNRNILPERFLIGSILRNERFSYKASASNHLLDSLYFLFNNTYEEVSFIPLHILTKYYPFTPKRYEAYFNVFSMANVRNELVTLFSNIEIKSGTIIIKNEEPFYGVTDFKAKIQYVLTALTRNLIFSLSSEIPNNRVDVRYTSLDICNCVQCSYFRLEFPKCFKALLVSGETLTLKLKNAYYQYQLGNYRTSVEQHLNIRDEALEAKKFLIYFICQHNLKHLGSFVANPFNDYGFSKEEIASLTSIDTLEEAVKLKSYTDYDLLSFIANGFFFKDAFETISDLTVKIEDHYYSHLKGGWGSNGFVWQLIEEFAALDSFINNNFIIYDAYSNFERLFGLFTKGLFASHALRNTQSSSLQHFDDYIVGRFIFYGDRKTIYKYFNRYNLKLIEYRPSSTESFSQLATNFLTNDKSTRDEFSKHSDKVNSHFRSNYTVIFDNIVTMAAILDLPVAVLNTVAKQLLTFIKKERWLNFMNYESIESFIHLKGNLFSKELLGKYFRWFLADIEKYQVDILWAILTRQKGKDLIIGKLGPILDKTLELSDPNIKHDRLNLFFNYFKNANLVDRKLIAQKINASLKKSFDYTIYYRAAIHGVVKIKKNDVFGLLNRIDLSKEVYTFQTVFSRRSSMFIDRLDSLINLCFKANIKTNGTEFQRFKNYSPYYAWILDIDNFEYINFDVEWLTHYQTKYYFNRMKKCKPLKKKVIDFLQHNDDPRIEKILVNII